MIILVDAAPGKDAFFCDDFEEGLSLLSVSYRPIMRLLQHPSTLDIRIPATPKKFFNLVSHLIATKQLREASIHTQKAVFQKRVVSGLKVKSYARTANEYILSWPENTLRVRFHSNAAKGLFYFYYVNNDAKK